nr:reverse transcriptase domain-containing protein [Tanacetum cinerariifolium]
MLAKSEARYARQAWSHAMDCNRVVHDELLALRAEVRTLHAEKLIAQGVANVLADYEANRDSGNGDDSYNLRSGGRRTVPTTRENAYSDILKCQPLNFKGTEGVVEFDQVEKYVGGLPDMIQGSVVESKPKTMQEAIEIANDLMDQKVRTFAERQAKNKRKLNDNTRNNQTHQ